MYKVSLIFLLLLLPQFANSQQVDPTKPFGSLVSTTSKEKKSALVLQSIIQVDSRKKAIINDQLLNVGDSYNGYELITINTNGVVLESPQGRMELSLFSGVIANSQ